MSTNALDFSININGVEYTNKFIEDIKIDKTDINKDFCEQHEKFAYYSTLHELAKDQELRLKKVMEDTYGQVDHEKRVEAAAMSEKNSKFKLTEKMCENEVKLNARYQRALLDYLDAKKLAGVLGVARESFNQRKEMLISLGANLRCGAFELTSLKDNAKNVINKNKE